MSKRIALDLGELENVSGGAIGFNNDGNGTYTMRCQFTGNEYYGVTLSQAMEISKYAAKIPNTLEGEEDIISWARSQGYI